MEALKLIQKIESELAELKEICGTPRPEEKRVELPKKIWFPTGDACMESFKAINEIIDYLASKPWGKS